ncbi:MAG: hypothetical protein KAJ39_02150 [Gammaproteobacteria bacterium]|nr:hypothetical protein [Gammaproteobacteria bacterium]
MYFLVKQHAIVLPVTEYEITFEATVNTPCSVLCNFYTYNPNYVEIDGDGVKVEILSSGKYSLQLSTSPDINDRSNTYIKLWNNELDFSDINISNIQYNKVGTATLGKNVISGSKNVIEPGILMVTTWEVQCGIATYSKHLIDSLKQYYNDDDIKIVSVNNGLPSSIEGEIIHFQHEFGIIPHIPPTNGNVILTWHTVPTKSNNEVCRIGNMDDVYHIVHTDAAKRTLMRSNVKDSKITVIPHGSVVFPKPAIDKKSARELLGLPLDMFIVFMFGFRSLNKGYGDILDLDIDNVLLLVTGAQNHNEDEIKMSKYVSKWTNSGHIQFLYKFLTEIEVTLYALASDAFIFNYVSDKAYVSSSGAMHRILGSGRPIICTDVPQFDELKHNISALKVNHPDDIENNIRLLMNSTHLTEKLGDNAMTISKHTSWEVVAHQHMDLYKKIRGN